MLFTYTPLDASQIAGRYRPPNWRDNAVKSLIDKGTVPSARIHDDATTQLYDFRRWLQQRCTAYDLAAVQGGARHVAEAVQTHELGCHGPRCTLETLVLVDEDRERIAKRMATTVPVVEFYELVFWDVRTRLSDHDFIINQCIGMQNVGANREKLACAATRLFAYLAGRGSIDLFAFPTGAPNRWQGVGNLVSAIVRRARLLLGAEALQDGRFTDPRAKRDLLRIIETLEQSNDNYGDEIAPKTKDERIVAGLLDAISRGAPSDSTES